MAVVKADDFLSPVPMLVPWGTPILYTGVGVLLARYALPHAPALPVSITKEVLFPLNLAGTALLSQLLGMMTARARFQHGVDIPFICPRPEDVRKGEPEEKDLRRLQFLSAARAHGNLVENIPIALPLVAYLNTTPLALQANVVYSFFLLGRAVSGMDYATKGPKARLLGFIPATLCQFLLAGMVVNSAIEYMRG
mmetsp:Transcript_30306/g.84696  ORF Transcript_30306/g.84696 Transcript_30306/m.84696 type:complete len:195 (+) Transcript_30306:85-669(+)|eukprot:CAMPEP_0119119712 /NCGR_PEP_ID=MMETSP1310-20130426/1082_1 /TAXON_ID=464262 /ORGANISM="Genus nov. species nov., Strain RCC2339" /LENGTH=194 /DNA_ID=CAMNT_0007109159 /DNA_START=85 /DNA_END=669 /DNA_ORIENTATION=+